MTYILLFLPSTPKKCFSKKTLGHPGPGGLHPSSRCRPQPSTPRWRWSPTSRDCAELAPPGDDKKDEWGTENKRRDSKWWVSSSLIQFNCIKDTNSYIGFIDVKIYIYMLMINFWQCTTAMLWIIASTCKYVCTVCITLYLDDFGWLHPPHRAWIWANYVEFSSCEICRVQLKTKRCGGYWLVWIGDVCWPGWWLTYPLWKIWVNGKDDIPYIMETTNQWLLGEATHKWSYIPN